MRRPSLRTRLLRTWTVPIWLLLASGLQPGTLEAQSRDRAAWQRVPDVITALSIGEGSRVADVGAGGGYFTERLARDVGTGGRVFAVEISEPALARLARLAESQGLDNVEVIRGQIDGPGLPDRSLDAVLVVNAYHEMTEHAAMLAGLYRALRPGGRLVILDLAPSDGGASRDRQTASHRLAITLAEQEILKAGFAVVSRDPEFTRDGRGRQQWMLVARRPTLPVNPRG
ncbi:MAG: methyltransferase domain-containing protein [Gemmatimonadetes bacterium]|nr:methyltransferase domain-containing protein [Gemmatimonadota bacterium]